MLKHWQPLNTSSFLYETGLGCNRMVCFGGLSRKNNVILIISMANCIQKPINKSIPFEKKLFACFGWATGRNIFRKFSNSSKIYKIYTSRFTFGRTSRIGSYFCENVLIKMKYLIGPCATYE